MSPVLPVPGWSKLGPLWWSDDGSTLELRSGHESFRLSGSLREVVRHGRVDDPKFLALVKLDTRLEPVRDALRTSVARPLTRADVLRGEGYRMLFLELTSQCNERCSHCYADSGPERTTVLSWD